MFEDLLKTGIVLPLWLSKLPSHVQFCIVILIVLHFLVFLGAIFFGIRATKSETSAGYAPRFSQDLKTKNQ